MIKPIAKLWTAEEWKEALAVYPELMYIVMYMAQNHSDSKAYDELIRHVSGGTPLKDQRRLTTRRAQTAFDCLEFDDTEGKSLCYFTNSDMENLRKKAMDYVSSVDPTIVAEGERILAYIGRKNDAHRLTLEHGTTVHDIKRDIAMALASLTKIPLIKVSGFNVPALADVATHPLHDLTRVLALALAYALVHGHEIAVTCLRYAYNDLKKDGVEVHAKHVFGCVSCEDMLAFKHELFKLMPKLTNHITILCSELTKAAPTWVCQGEHSGLPSHKRNSFHEAYPNAQIPLGNKQM
jgi:hypothetical protein